MTLEQLEAIKARVTTFEGRLTWNQITLQDCLIMKEDRRALLEYVEQLRRGQPERRDSEPSYSSY